MRSASQQDGGDVSSSGINETQPCEKGGVRADRPGSVHMVWTSTGSIFSLIALDFHTAGWAGTSSHSPVHQGSPSFLPQQPPPAALGGELM